MALAAVSAASNQSGRGWMDVAKSWPPRRCLRRTRRFSVKPRDEPNECSLTDGPRGRTGAGGRGKSPMQTFTHSPLSSLLLLRSTLYRLSPQKLLGRDQLCTAAAGIKLITRPSPLMMVSGCNDLRGMNEMSLLSDVLNSMKFCGQ